MDGILNIDKPKDKTSFSIVATVKRLSGEKRVGHAGTLDPAATGVLPVCLGRGTRVVEYLVDTTKTYQAEIEMGIVTDTYDASGEVTQIADYSTISREQLESALNSYRGLIAQTPPMYSAVKYQGKPLYQLARAGIKVNRKSRPANIHSLKLIDWQPPLLTIEVVCGKGTYVRSLAHDLGQTIGCGAHLKSLVRSRCGPFDIKNALSLPQLEDAFHHGYWQHFVYPIDIVLSHWSAMVVNSTTGQAISQGCSIGFDDNPKDADNVAQYPTPLTPGQNRCRVYTSQGSLLGLLHFNPESRQWQPEKVFL